MVKTVEYTVEYTATCVRFLLNSVRIVANYVLPFFATNHLFNKEGFFLQSTFLFWKLEIALIHENFIFKPIVFWLHKCWMKSGWKV